MAKRKLQIFRREMQRSLWDEVHYLKYSAYVCFLLVFIVVPFIDFLMIDLVPSDPSGR